MKAPHLTTLATLIECCNLNGVNPTARLESAPTSRWTVIFRAASRAYVLVVNGGLSQRQSVNPSNVKNGI